MFNNLIVPAIFVVAIWIIIIAIYLVVSRRQPDVAATLRSLDEELDAADNEDGQR